MIEKLKAQQYELLRKPGELRLHANFCLPKQKGGQITPQVNVSYFTLNISITKSSFVLSLLLVGYIKSWSHLG